MAWWAPASVGLQGRRFLPYDGGRRHCCYRRRGTVLIRRPYQAAGIGSHGFPGGFLARRRRLRLRRVGEILLLRRRLLLPPRRRPLGCGNGLSTWEKWWRLAGNTQQKQASGL